MDRTVSNDMTGVSIILPLATIEEDIDEIDNNDDDDDDDESPKYNNITKMIDNNACPLHTHQSNNEIPTESITTTIHYQNDFRNHNTDSCSNNSTIVPFIVVTHEEINANIKSKPSRVETSSISSLNMDNISLKDYYSQTSCPSSPTLPNKLLLSRSTASTLSPPGLPSATSSTSLASSGKRRGLGLASIQRASHKRAHTGRYSVDHTPNELFIELQELRQIENNEYEWHECARWIRYEEDYDFEMERWQAPRIGCLNFHSLLELRRGLQYGIVLLDLEEQKLECIYEAIINDAIANGQMNKDVKDEILRCLTSIHKHPEARSSRRRSSTMDYPPSAGRRASLAFRKNEQISTDITHGRRMSLFDSIPNGELMKNLKNLVVKYDNTEDPMATDSHIKKHPLEPIESNNTDNNSNENVTQPHRPSISQGFTIQRSTQLSTKKSREANSYKSDVMRCVSEHAECAEVLIGSIRSLTRPVMAFVRLSQGQLINDITEVPIPVRFIFLLIGPAMEEYLEIGRALSTLFSTLDFRETAYQAMDRRDLLHGVNDFLSDSIVLPPGDFDKELLLPIIETNKMKKMNIKRRLTRLQSQHIDRIHDPEQQSQTAKILLSQMSTVSRDKHDEDPFKRSGFVFGGVCREMRRRYDHYKSDFLDAISLNCFVSLVFMFIACLAPALTFGGIIADKTNNRLGVNEMLIASSLHGFLFGFVSGQPLLILGPTGPFLVFEEMVYDLCQSLQSDFWTVRCCVSLWTTFFIIILVAFEGSFMIRHVTRFTEEIFALIIAVIYLYEPFKKLYKIFQLNPVRSNYNYDYPLNCSCNITSLLNTSFTLENLSNNFSSTLKYSCYDCVPPKRYTSSSSSSSLLKSNYTSISRDESHLPNKALLSFIILLGTCLVAVALKRFRRSNFFGRATRQTLSDFGMTIALICMVLFDMFITKNAGGHSLTQKITVPKSIRPSDRERGNIWFISPFRKRLPFWLYFASSFPAILISVVLFFEVELTSIMIQSKLKCVHSSKIIKGTGYHLDILIAGVLISISGLFGLPWICAAPVRSIAHVASLSKYSKTHAPGEKPRLIDIKDQRLTNIGVHILIGCTIFAGPIIRKIPVAALFGIFLYFGIVSIPGTQLFSRVKMMFIPAKYHPNVGYLRRVRQIKRFTYTIVQIIAAGLLITIKVTSFAFLFPFILVLLVPFRKWCLPCIFTERELTELDGDEEHGSVFDDEVDFYGQVHLPI
ncbi:unnamed protein product [Adineta steineri]|uniref:Anion exchange protein n=1 Tax=Adineta steineri TaxID=433720 RepID=A0A815DYF6_9BILA|nr:unnamed protein product [Adineta steineri]